MTGAHPDLVRWRDALRTLALRVVDPAGAADEAARLAGADPVGLLRPLLLRRLDETIRAAVAGEPPEGPSPDVAIWWQLLRAPASRRLGTDVDREADGPLVPQDRFTTIEVWTETDLAALHALDRHRVEAPEAAAWSARVDRAVAWHLEHTQPDNATNHPWGLVAFLRAGSPEGVHLAETMLGNALVANAAPDPTSAWILLDGADLLDRVLPG